MWTRHDGRAAIADLSLARLAAARGGRPRPTVIVGEAGSGKTTLLDRVCAAATGVVTIRVRPGADDVPYAPLHAALEPLMTTLAASPRRELLVALHAATAPGVRVTTQSRPRVLSLVTMTLEALDALTPVIVCVDDLHAADADTAAAFWHLATHVHERRVWLLGATRNERSELGAHAALRLDRLAASNDIDVIELPPLLPEEIADLVRQRVGSPPSHNLVNLLLERAGGNAFYTVELLDSLSRSDALEPSHDGLRLIDGAAPSLPDTVSHFVNARVDSIGRDALVVGTRVAVLRSMPITSMPILANLAGISMRRTEQAFDQLVAAGVAVERDGRWRCSHDLMREALYDSLGPAERSDCTDRPPSCSPRAAPNRPPTSSRSPGTCATAPPHPIRRPPGCSSRQATRSPGALPRRRCGGTRPPSTCCTRTTRPATTSACRSAESKA